MMGSFRWDRSHATAAHTIALNFATMAIVTFERPYMPTPKQLCSNDVADVGKK